MAKFTKAEMVDELKEIVFQYARGVSFALAEEDGYRLLFGKNPDNKNDIRHFMNPAVTAATYDQSFSIDHYQATRSVKQFYDYGLLGIRNISPESISSATEWTLAYGLVYDAANSFLISDVCNGEYVTATKCQYAANAFFARLILDGNDRENLPGNSGPDDMLTIAEVAILADLDERTVRNATSKNATNRLETKVVESSIYIPRESARAWLQNKRGFIPTRIGDELPSEAALSHAFTSTTEAGQYIRQNRERLKLSHRDLIAAIKNNLTEHDLVQLESGHFGIDEKSLISIGNVFGINGRLFSLRIAEAKKKQELQDLQLKIAKSESPPKTIHIDELDLSPRTGNTFRSANILTLEEIAKLSVDELNAIPG